MNTRRVVVTGLGSVTALGPDVDTYWSNVLAGKSGISTIERVDTSDISSHIGGEVKDFDIENFMSRRDARRLDRSAQFFWVATQQALDDAGLSYEEDDPEALLDKIPDVTPLLTAKLEQLVGHPAGSWGCQGGR